MLQSLILASIVERLEKKIQAHFSEIKYQEKKETKKKRYNLSTEKKNENIEKLHTYENENLVIFIYHD